MYAPIVHLIKGSGIAAFKNILKRFNNPEIHNNSDKTGTSKSDEKSLNSGFSIKYCGSVHVGSEGDVKQIEKAILQVLKKEEIKLVSVTFECLEIGITVTEDRDDTVCKYCII